MGGPIYCNGKRREITLGWYPKISLADVTLETSKLQSSVRQGIDPLAEKKRPDSLRIRTVDDLAKDWLKNDISKRLKHPQIPRRIYERFLSPPFGELALERVTPNDVRHAIEGSPPAAGRLVLTRPWATANNYSGTVSGSIL